MRPETTTQPDAERAISTEALAFRKRVKVRDTTMAYVDVGEGDAIARFVAKVLARQLSLELAPRPA